MRIGDRQYNLHASRHMHMERLDTQVGPIRVEVLEPLQRLRVVVDDNAHGISADLTIDGRHAPIEEPRTIRHNGPRLIQDMTRMTQLGRWSGWIKAGGREVRIEPATALGTRDRLSMIYVESSRSTRATAHCCRVRPRSSGCRTRVRWATFAMPCRCGAR